MGWKSDSDELDARPQPIVAIPIRRSWMILRFIICLAVTWAVPVILVLCMAAKRQWKWDLGSDDSAFRIIVFLPLAVVAMMVLAALFWPWLPEFAVFKDGIKLPDNRRHPPKRSIWDHWSYGFYYWGEVSYCRWSRYQKGVLAVHLKAAEHCVDVVFWGTGSSRTRKLPAMVFDYRVPERCRAAVEAAIRACGKWAE